MYRFQNQVLTYALFLILSLSVFAYSYGILYFEIPLAEGDKSFLIIALFGSVLVAAMSALNIVLLYLFMGIEILVKRIIKKYKE